MLRNRSRSSAANNPWIANAVGNMVAALVGSGITPVPKHPVGETRKLLSAFFDHWNEDADADGRTDFYGMLADVVRALVIDGEAFLQILTTEDGLRLRLIPSELVDESMTRDLTGGGMIVSGVEFNADGRRVAYWIFPSKPADQFATYAPPVRISAEDILHVFKPIAAGQVRGISWLAPVILPANEFDQLLDALLVGVKVAAMHAGFLVDQNGSGEPYDGTGTGGIMETGLEPGTLKRLPTGYDIKFNAPQQASEVSAFLRLNLQQLAAGLGLPEHLLSGDLTGANYSSLRAGLLPFRQRIEQIQYGVLIPQLLRPVWRRVVTFSVLSGELDAPDFEQHPRDWLSVDWLPPRPMQVDPLKDTEASIAEIEAGLTSRRKAVAERGWDIDDLDSEIAADRVRETTIGLNFGPRQSTVKKDVANVGD
ncbi:phage portal protein [Rhizobium sp. 58]|nr:phage portal protein [Rhizobium sp. 58]